jgi:hypothetical protein
MSYYTDPSTNFKLAYDTNRFSRRTLKLWDMILNRLGVPDRLHEPVKGVFVADNWEEVNHFKLISISKMAHCLTSNDSDYRRIYNRLKKSIPKFFDWQSGQSILIIDREILIKEKYKTKAQYRFMLAEQVHQLLNLPPDTPHKQLQRAVEKVFENIPILDIPQRKKRKPTLGNLARKVRRTVNQMVEMSGSKALVTIELQEADLDPSEGVTIKELITY